MSLNKLSLIWERAWPWLGAICIVLLWRNLGSPFPPTPDNLFSAGAGVAAVFASFLGVAKAIILSIKDSKTYQVLKERGYADDLFGYLRGGIFASVFFASLSILGFFISKDAVWHGYKVFTVFSALWILAGALSALTYIRISNILFKLLRIV